MAQFLKKSIRPALAALLVVALALPAVSGAVSLDIDLNDWEQRGPPANGAWSVAIDGSTVTQTVADADPTYFVSDRGYRDTRFSGTFTAPASDDDIVGWTIDHLYPTGTGTFHGGFRLDWKALTQTANGYTANEGFTLYFIDGNVDPTTANLFACFWGKSETDCPVPLTVLATDHGAGLGWEPGATYTWALRLEENLIRMHITGGTGLLAAGRTVIDHTTSTLGVNPVGFFTFHQGDATWGDVAHLDEYAPTITGTETCSDPGSGTWCLGTWDVTASAVDHGSGMNTIVCKDTGVVGPCTQTLSGDGTHLWRVTATDLAGNSKLYARNLRIDTVAPEITTSVACTGGADPMACATDLSFGPTTTTDATSGVGTTTCTLDGAPVDCLLPAPTATEGVHTYVVDVVDVAGNTNSTSVTGALDFTPPTPQAIVTCTPWFFNGWCQNTIKTRGAATDAGSGVADIACQLDGVNYTCDLTPTTVEGVHNFSVTATDAAGHTNSTYYVYQLDNTAPSATYTADVICTDPLCFDVEEVHFTVNATDALSGVQRIEFLVDGWILHTAFPPGIVEWTWDASTWGAITGPLMGATPDQYGFFHTVEIRVIDVAGNAVEYAEDYETFV